MANSTHSKKAARGRGGNGAAAVHAAAGTRRLKARATGGRRTASTTKSKARKPRVKANGGNGGILAWEDDPGAPTAGTPISRPVPGAPQHALATALRINGAAPKAGQFPVGSANFRYWTAAEALARAAAFWASILPAGTRWFTGASLPVSLDSGLDLNAYYDRTELAFFHESVGDITVFSGESPDIVAHELGHAVLDAIRPQLWDAAAAEPAAFHEAFGDISAILAALQLDSLRAAVLAETEGKLYRNSRLSRVAEQLGWAIRQRHPDAVDADCLRNAVNSFFYRDPQSLPPRAPAGMLSSEPHSFARVFVGAFFEALAGMVPRPATSQNLLDTATDAARLLVDAVYAAPIVPDYYSQVAAHMLEADHVRTQARYAEPLKAAFVRHGILSLEATLAMHTEMAAVPAGTRAMAGPAGAAAGAAAAAASSGGNLTVDGHRFGLGNRKLVVQAPSAQKRFAVAAAAPSTGSVTPPSPDNAVHAFLEDLFRLGRVSLAPQTMAAAAGEGSVKHPFSRKTHRLVGAGTELKLERQCFACGLATCL